MSFNPGFLYRIVTLMDKGLVLALFSALSFSISTVYIRRTAFKTGESFTSVAISVFTAVLFFTSSLFITGEWGILWSISGKALALFAGAGIMHFVLGRLLNYGSYRLIGANRGNAIQRTQIFYAVILGVVLLHEPVTGLLILGVLGIAIGATLVSFERGDETGKVRTQGILAALGGAFFWGTSGVLIKPAEDEVGSPYVGAFVSFATASLVLSGLLLGKKQREQLVQLPCKYIFHLIIAGIFSATAQLLRYAALIYSPVSVVTPISGTNTLFTLFLSFLFNRQIELFSWKVIIGILVAIAGTILLFQ